MEAVELQGSRRRSGARDARNRVNIANVVVMRAHFTPRCNDRDDKALKLSLQNLLDSLFIAVMWGFSRCWSVRVD
jgi:hypothetical protein